MGISRILIHSLILCLLTVFSVSLAYGVTIDTVRVGDTGNQADTRYASPGYGSVGYAYNIGKYEVTAGQYAAFLNAVAKTDRYGVYNSDMADAIRGDGITRSGASGSYAYSVGTNFINRPVDSVRFWDIVRFTNWLHNGQPTGAQGPSTTEDGAYFINGWGGYQGGFIQRKPGAKWFLPNEDEWYKAAYYKGGGTNAGYWRYPTRSDTAPGRDLADPSGNNANYGAPPVPPSPIQPPYYTTVVGEFQNSASPYGTFDQGGNLWEWNETVVYRGPNTDCRGIRGGNFLDTADHLSGAVRLSDQPEAYNFFTGFRVANMAEGWQPVVPEPGSMVILGSGILALAGMIRRKK